MRSGAKLHEQKSSRRTKISTYSIADTRVCNVETRLDAAPAESRLRPRLAAPLETPGVETRLDAIGRDCEMFEAPRSFRPWRLRRRDESRRCRHECLRHESLQNAERQNV